jgi:hypothetical protein
VRCAYRTSKNPNPSVDENGAHERLSLPDSNNYYYPHYRDFSLVIQKFNFSPTEEVFLGNLLDYCFIILRKFKKTAIFSNFLNCETSI